MNGDRGLFEGLVGDGRPLLNLFSVGIILAGLFGIFLGISGQFLPHDEQFLGMTAQDLCSHHGCRIVHFMIHDRIAFGGALVAIGILYLWLVEFPLRQGQAWSWWLLLLTGTLGFATFFSYLAYGYLDTWHGVATLGLLPCFILGLARTYALLTSPRNMRTMVRPSVTWSWSLAGFARACLLATSLGLIGGGLVIFLVGMTSVFVPQDLTYMGVSVGELNALNPRLIPLIAHDRAGFGGAVFLAGLTVFFCVWCGAPSTSLWQALALAGLCGFATAIGVHPAIGYDDAVHLAPPVVGALGYLVGLAGSFKAYRQARAADRKSLRRVPLVRRGQLEFASHGPCLARNVPTQSA
jgi:hypothetical protein